MTAPVVLVPDAGADSELVRRLRGANFAVAAADDPDAVAVVVPMLGSPGGYVRAWELRGHRRLHHRPVVLVSPFPVGADDLRAARRVGATAMATLDDLTAVLRTGLGDPAPCPGPGTRPDEEQLAFLERHACADALHTAQLDLLERVADVASDGEEPAAVVAEALAHVIGAVSQARGAVYLLDERGVPALVHQIGLSGDELALLDHDRLVRRVVTTGRPVVRQWMVVTPVPAGAERLGAMIVHADDDLHQWVPLLDATCKQIGLALRLARTSQQLAAADQVLHHRTRHDALTGLPNRVLLTERLGAVLQDAGGAQSRGALVVVGLDRFRGVNQALGHRLGDAVLQEVGTRLRDALGSDETLVRSGGDEFAVLHPAIDDHAAPGYARRLIHTLDDALDVEGRALYVTASAGTAFIPSHGRDPETLLQRAELAMHRAKRSGGHHVEHYRPEYDATTPERVAIEQGLRAALDGNATGLGLHYQPIVDLRSRGLRGVEALLRWTHPELGDLSPGAVIPVAEEAGLMPELGAMVLDVACRQAASWHAAGWEGRVSVNVDAAQLAGHDLPEAVGRALDESGLDPTMLQLEVTETAAVLDLTDGGDALQKSRELGVRVALDDFGTGYSSLAYLQHLPVDTVKIDRSFVKELANDTSNEAIVASVIDLSHRLGMHVVAEGVETEDQAVLLTGHLCDEGQGYLFSPPVSADRLDRSVAASS